MIAREYPFTEDEMQRISSAIRTYHTAIEHRTNKEWFKFVDVEHVLTLIQTGLMPTALLDDSYLVLYTIGAPWYHPSIQFVQEQLVLRVGAGGTLRKVTDFLEHKAKFHNAAGVAVGTALAHNDESLKRMYAKRGYNQQGVQLLKLT